MDGDRTSWLAIGVWYIILLLIVQFGIYVMMPKESGGCQPSSFPSSAAITSLGGEQFYCRRQNHGYEIVGEDEFIASFSDPDYDRGPIAIAGFYWTYERTAFREFSLWSLWSDHRYLHFDAREGSRGEYQPLNTSQQLILRRDIAGAMRSIRYLQPPNGAIFVPILDLPMFFLKLIVHAMLVMLAYRMIRLWEQCVVPYWKTILSQDPNACVHCGYDRTGLPTPICPECGQIHAPSTSA